jgi:hypothetical protein
MPIQVRGPKTSFSPTTRSLAFETPLISVLAVDPLDTINNAIKRAGRVAEAAAERAEQITETRSAQPQDGRR